MVRILIEAGADVKSTHPDGRNALSFAAERGHIEICKMLVQAGSEIDSVDMLGRTALSWQNMEALISLFTYGSSTLSLVKMIDLAAPRCLGRQRKDIMT
jgi:ankyrin repeat protein